MRWMTALVLTGALLGVGAQAASIRACTIELPPQSMTDKHGKPDGYATRILEGVAKRLQWSLDIRYMPWARLVLEAKAGHLSNGDTTAFDDALLAFKRSPEFKSLERRHLGIQ